MNAQAQFWADFYGWCLGLGFLIIAGLIIAVFCLMASPWGLKRQKHKQEIQKMRLRAELAKKGMDPEYIKFMEKNLEK